MMLRFLAHRTVSDVARPVAVPRTARQPGIAGMGAASCFADVAWRGNVINPVRYFPA
jgi:hypothetical protein